MSSAHEDQIRVLLRENRRTEAFELVIAAYGDRMLRLAMSMLGDRARAEDAVQDVMVRIWRALPQFRGDATLSTWVYAITRNRCLTMLKQREGHRMPSLDDPDVHEAVTRAHVAREPVANADVRELVDALPPQYRQVLTLFYMEEQSYEEIARLLDMPLGTVKTHLHRAKKMLAALYQS